MGDRVGTGCKLRAASLTAAKVRNAGPGKHHDGGGLGLVLVVDPNGARRWVQRIIIHGKRREVGLGGWPVVGLAEARSGNGEQAHGAGWWRSAGREAQGANRDHLRGCGGPLPCQQAG